MPLTIKKQGGKFIVTDPSGKKFGTHDTKQGAIDQIGAIESNKAKSAIDLVAEDNIRVLAAELDAAHGTDQPPVMILSDGTPEGTMLFIHGQPVPAKRVEMYCSHDPDYPHCDLSVTMVEEDASGMRVEKTLRLRKEPPSEPTPY